MYMKKKKDNVFTQKEREIMVIKKTVKYTFDKDIEDYYGFISDKILRYQRDIILSFMFEMGFTIPEMSEVLSCRKGVISESLYFNDWALNKLDRETSYISLYYAFMEEFNAIKDKLIPKKRTIEDLYK